MASSPNVAAHQVFQSPKYENQGNFDCSMGNFGYKEPTAKPNQSPRKKQKAANFSRPTPMINICRQIMAARRIYALRFRQ
jgi:hypothetical protein